MHHPDRHRHPLSAVPELLPEPATVPPQREALAGDDDTSRPVPGHLAPGHPASSPPALARLGPGHDHLVPCRALPALHDCGSPALASTAQVSAFRESPAGISHLPFPIPRGLPPLYRSRPESSPRSADRPSSAVQALTQPSPDCPSDPQVSPDAKAGYRPSTSAVRRST